MSRTWIRTTVDSDLLAAVRERRSGVSDSSVLDEALRALLSDLESAEVHASSWEAYDRLPFNTPDAWGDLASFGAAADAS